MKIICEYCGTQIDVNKDSICPSCGASFESNVSYKNFKEHKKKHDEIELKEREASLENRKLLHQTINNVTGTFNNVSNVFKFVPIIILFMIIVFVFVFYNISKTFSERTGNIINDSNSFFEQFDDNSDVEKKVVVNLNEFAETSKYRVKVDSYEVIKKYPFDVLDGYEVVTFHFIVENLTGEKYWLRDSINCVVDGIAQNNKYNYDRDELAISIDKGLTIHGYKAFEVPKNAGSYDIKFGDYVTIHIEK